MASKRDRTRYIPVKESLIALIASISRGEGYIGPSCEWLKVMDCFEEFTKDYGIAIEHGQGMQPQVKVNIPALSCWKTLLKAG